MDTSIQLFNYSIIIPLLYFSNNLKPTQNMQEIVQSTYSTFLSFFFGFSTNPRPPSTPTQQPPQALSKDTIYGYKSYKH